MRLASLVPVTLAVMLSAGCGARTGEDELLTTDLSADGGGSGGSGGTSGAGGQSAGGTSGAGGAPTTGGASSGGGQNGSCCQPSEGRGCPVNPSIAACVCENDSFCCMGAWDETCVREVEEYGCGICQGGTGGSSGGGSGGQGAGGQGAGGQGTGGVPPAEDCCLTHSSPRCFDQGITECVCEADLFCCETGWDVSCVDHATVCGAGCGATGGTGGQNTGGQGSGGTDTGGSGAVGSGGTGGQGTGGQGVGGGNPYCDYFTPGTCESCSCNYCYDPLVACLGDAGCTCILASGCSGVAECMSDEYCGDELSAGGAFTSIGRAYQLVSCETNSGCPCF